MAETRRFKTNTGWREPSVKALKQLLERMSSRGSTEPVRAKIWDAIEHGGDIDLSDAERRTVVGEIRLWMQDGRVDAELAGIRHDESP